MKVKNPTLAEKLQDFKFTQAKMLMASEDLHTQVIIEALADTFGDTGLIDGNLGVIVGFVINTLTEDEIL